MNLGGQTRLLNEHLHLPAKHLRLPVGQRLSSVGHSLLPGKHLLSPDGHVLLPGEHLRLLGGQTLSLVEHVLLLAGYFMFARQTNIFARKKYLSAGRFLFIFSKADNKTI